MDMVFGFIGPLFSLLVLGAIVAVIAAIARRPKDEEDDEPGIGTLRRVFYYLLGFIALSVAVTGLCLLLSTILDPLFGRGLIVRGENRLALALALTLVATPIWLWLWSRSLQAVREFPVEGRSLGRKLYIYLVQGVAGIAGAISLVAIIRWAFRINEPSSIPWAVLLVMAGVWVFHRRADAGEPEGRGPARLMPRLYYYMTAFYALAMLAAGTGMVLGRHLLEAYHAVFGTFFLDETGVRLWSRWVRESLSIAIVGGLWWSAHWGWMARSDREPGLRQVYLYLFAVLGGAVTTVVATAILVFGTLSWVVGVPGLDPAAEHFRFIPGSVAGLVIGLALWGYHYAVIREETPGAERRFIGARRGYQYLVSAVGLGTLAVGLVLVFGVALGLLLPRGDSLVSTGGEWKRLITLAITLIAVGAPLWGYHWSAVQREASIDPVVERARVSRGVFIYGVFCIALLLTLGNMSALLFTLFRDVMEGDLGPGSLQDSKWFAASLLMAAAISVYYGFVLREDRRIREAAAPAQPAQALTRKRVTAVASPEARELVRRVETSLGYPVTWWRAVDGGAGSVPAVDDAEWSTLPQRVAQAPTERVLLMIDSGGVRVLPYQAETPA